MGIITFHFFPENVSFISKIQDSNYVIWDTTEATHISYTY